MGSPPQGVDTRDGSLPAARMADTRASRGLDEANAGAKSDRPPAHRPVTRNQSRQRDGSGTIPSSLEPGLRLILDHLPQPVVWESETGMIVYCNRPFCELIAESASPESLTGQSLFELINGGPSVLEGNRQLYRALSHLRKGASTAQFALPDGKVWECKLLAETEHISQAERIYVFSSAAPGQRPPIDTISLGLSNQGFASILNSGLARLRDGLSRLARAGVDAPPLGPPPASPRKDSSAPSLHGSGELSRLSRLARDLDEFARLEARTCHLTEGPFSPRGLCSEVVAPFQSRLGEAGPKLEIRVGQAVPERLLGDSERLRIVLLHLLENAIEHTPQGRVRLNVAAGHPGWFRYEVEDTGAGMPSGGLGLPSGEPALEKEQLGLRLCRSLAALMGGALSFESAQGKGSRVWMEVPHATVDAGGAASTPESERTLSILSMRPGAISPTKILLVEDDPSNQLLLKRTLQAAGFEVTCAGRAQEALQYLAQHPTDVLVTDISMPGMDGIELVSSLRRLESELRRPRTPTVVVTAYTTETHQVRCRQAGVDVFLTKPIQSATLCRALAKVAEGRPKVLIVAENARRRDELRAALQDQPISLEVAEAVSGSAAILACIEHQYALIVMDTFHPGSDGTLAVQKIRKLKDYTDVPIVACSPDRGTELQLLAAGVTDVVPQALDVPGLLGRARHHLRLFTVPRTPGQDFGAASLGATLPKFKSRTASARDEAVVLEFDAPAAPPPLVPELHDMFLSNCRAELANLRTALSVGDYSVARRIGHTLLGNGSSFGMDEISALGGAIERAATSHDAPRLFQAYEELSALLRSAS